MRHSNQRSGRPGITVFVLTVVWHRKKARQAESGQLNCFSLWADLSSNRPVVRSVQEDLKKLLTRTCVLEEALDQMSL